MIPVDTTVTPTQATTAPATTTPVITTIPATTTYLPTKSNEDLLNEIISLLESFEHLQHATTTAPKLVPSSTINFYDLLNFFTTQPTTPTTAPPIERHIEKIADRLFEKFIDKLESEIIVRDLPTYLTTFAGGKENGRVLNTTADPKTRPIYHLRTSVRRRGETVSLPRIVIRKNDRIS
jgi:hypothetical protein